MAQKKFLSDEAVLLLVMLLIMFGMPLFIWLLSYLFPR